MKISKKTVDEGLRRQADQAILSYLRRTHKIYLVAILVVFFCFSFYVSRQFAGWLGDVLLLVSSILLSVTLSLTIYDILGPMPEALELRNLVAEARTGASARQLGITEIFARRTQSLNNVLEDISASKTSVLFHAVIYISEIVREEQRLYDALDHAISRSASGNGVFHIRYGTTSPSNTPQTDLFLHLWALREANKDEAGLRARIIEGHRRLRQICFKLAEKHQGKVKVDFYFFKD